MTPTRYNTIQLTNSGTMQWYALPIHQLTQIQLQFIIPYVGQLFYNNKTHFLQYIQYNKSIFDSLYNSIQHVTSLLNRVIGQYNYILFNYDINDMNHINELQCIGVVGIKADVEQLQANQSSVECGYLLDSNYTGYGIVYITLLYSIQQLFMHSLQINTIELHTHKHNRKSVSVAHRLQFVLDMKRSTLPTLQQPPIDVYVLHRQTYDELYNQHSKLTDNSQTTCK